MGIGVVVRIIDNRKKRNTLYKVVFCVKTGVLSHPNMTERRAALIYLLAHYADLGMHTRIFFLFHAIFIV